MIKESTYASGAYETAVNAIEKPDFQAMYEAAAKENDSCYERMAKMRIEYESKIEELKKELEWWKREHDLLNAQMSVVHLIFGGGKE